MSNTAIKKYRLSDFVLIGATALCALALTILFFASNESHLCVSVYQSNKLIYQKELSEVESPYEYTVHSDIDVVLYIENDGVTVIKSDCPDKLCQKVGKLTRGGQSAVCLPAKLSITLSESANSYQSTELDGITR